MTQAMRPGLPGKSPPVLDEAVAERLSLFYRTYFLGLVRRTMWRRRLSNEDAQDIVQEAFLLAIKKLRHDGNVNAWLKAVVDRIAAGRSRTDRRRAGLAAKWGLGIEYLKEPEMTLHRDGDEVLR